MGGGGKASAAAEQRGGSAATYISAANLADSPPDSSRSPSWWSAALASRERDAPRLGRAGALAKAREDEAPAGGTQVGAREGQLSSGRWWEVESRWEEHALTTKGGSVVSSIVGPRPQGGGRTWGSGFCLGLHACLTHSVHLTVCGLIDARTLPGRKTIPSPKACLICSIVSDFTDQDTPMPLTCVPAAQAFTQLQAHMATCTLTISSGVSNWPSHTAWPKRNFDLHP